MIYNGFLWFIGGSIHCNPRHDRTGIAPCSLAMVSSLSPAIAPPRTPTHFTRPRCRPGRNSPCLASRRRARRCAGVCRGSVVQRDFRATLRGARVVRWSSLPVELTRRMGILASLRRVEFAFGARATRIMKDYCYNDQIPKEQSPIVTFGVCSKLVIEHRSMLAARLRFGLICKYYKVLGWISIRGRQRYPSCGFSPKHLIVIVKIKPPHNLPRNPRNPAAIDPLYYLISGQHQATRSRIELAQHFPDEPRIAAPAESIEGLLVDSPPCVRAADRGHQRMNKIVLIFLKSLIAGCVCWDSK